VRSWILYFGLIVFGILWILLGLAEPHYDFKIVSFLVGGVFCSVGTIGLARCKRDEAVPPFDSEDRRRELLLGVAMTAAALLGAIYIPLLQPPRTDGEAPWANCVLFAISAWFVAAGIFMIKHSRLP
jgi:hypothetical protein